MTGTIMNDSESIAWHEGEDPEMVNAINKAQDSFDEFISALLFTNDIEESLVKYMFPTTNPACVCEHMFVSELAFEDNDLYGYLYSTPQYAKDVKEGDKVLIKRDRVSDWLFVIDNKGTGGFTFRVMWSAFSNSEKEMYKSQPPFCWLNLA